MTQQNITCRPLAPFTQNRYVTLTLLLLLGIGTGCISMMLGAAYFGLPMFYAYFGSPMLILLNLLPPVLILFLAYFIGGRAWIAFLITSVVVLALSIIDFFKIQIRSEPLVLSDFGLTEEVGNVANGYAMIINWKVWLAAFYVVAGTVFSGLLLRYRPGKKTRLIGMAAVAAVSSVAYLTLYNSEKLYGNTKAAYAINIWSNSEKSIARGFTYPFIYSLQDWTNKPPDGYKASQAAELLASYTDDSIPDDKKVNVISVMLESYADLSQLDILEFKEDVYGPLHALQQESVYGSIVANTFAGGTTNSERSFLTGYTHLGDFQLPTNSYVRYLSGQGYYTEGFHAGYEWYYDRDRINDNLGYDRYYFLEDLETEDRTDEFFFSQVEKMFDTRDSSAPYFSYNLTFQNHGPYDSEITSDTAYIEKGSLSESAYCILNNYFEGVADTSEQLASFVDNFRTMDEPVVIVLYGDHKPWLGNAYVVYSEVGINIDLSTEEGFYNFYTTPYIIWANDAAKEILDNDFTGFGGDISPCFLMNKVFDLCGWKGNAFMKASNTVYAVTDIVSADGYFRENGELATALSDEAKTIYNDYRKIEYYWQHKLSY